MHTGVENIACGRQKQKRGQVKEIQREGRGRRKKTEIFGTKRVLGKAQGTTVWSCPYRLSSRTSRTASHHPPRSGPASLSPPTLPSFDLSTSRLPPPVSLLGAIPYFTTSPPTANIDFPPNITRFQSLGQTINIRSLAPSSLRIKEANPRQKGPQ
ncbi:uncharacterized protein BDZ83DRAFT_23130 [Colletotrichum acutatum]|uniref:Uncharacterized protein n=1 Tax=Glomerella acutata TaxID=27357 RepID=A0AAD8XBD7_GLOAC|nr:uncharacterized protein BDZ83DRAFT_23130 [Colletotrichum acutatum]KAK1718042.1 hypothetical protein BDZ83DRAFT_23130 [Colletotrichum acutatum]